MLSMQSKPMTPIDFARERTTEDDLDAYIGRINRVWRYAIEQGAELRPFSRYLELNSFEIQFLMSKYSDIPSESEPAAVSKAKLTEKALDKQKTTTETTPPKTFATAEPSKEMKTKPTAKPNPQPTQWALPTVLDLINYGEMIAAAVGLWLMFNWAGLVFSLITNAFYFDAMRTVKKATSWDSAQFALFVVFILSTVYAFVHFNTAMKTISQDTQFDKFTVAVTAAIILSGISWAAMRQSFLKKNEEVDNG